MRVTVQSSIPPAESPKDRRRRQLHERQWQAHRQDVERTRRYVKREGLVGVLNDTKWEEFVHAMRALAFGPQYRQKHVRAEEPADWDWDWYYHLRPFSCVEWVDIDPVDRDHSPPIDHTAEVEAALRRIHVPFSREGQYLRVWGYTRPGSAAVFA